jgi:hypothetical protein
LAVVAEAIALALGGEGGARILARLGLIPSPDTPLNIGRAAVGAPIAPPRVLGIDDWSWRRGQRFGTILVDLEQHRIVDLLGDREVDSVVTWLRRHPQITVITRDRGGTYAEAASKGAPQAMQVADRWHLLVRRFIRYAIPVGDGKGSEGGLWANGDRSMPRESGTVPKTLRDRSRKARVIR